jgi:hypothetical protein
MRCVAAIVMLVALSGCLLPPVDAGLGPASYVVSLPWITLQGAERISGVRVELMGARVRAVNTVPEDWSVAFEPATQGRSVLTMSAQHGTAWLRNSYGLERFLTVTADDSRRTEIRVNVKLSSANGERELALGPGDVVLDPFQPGR